MKEYAKTAKEGEILIYKEVLNEIAKDYNPEFLILELPTAVVCEEQKKLVLPYYEGTTFNDIWKEEYGGSKFGMLLLKEVPIIIDELSKIDISRIVNNESLNREISKLQFNTQDYLDNDYDRITSIFEQKGVLDQGVIANAKAIIEADFQSSKKIINNADFYPRNFIKTPGGKIVLLDWDPWNDRQDRGHKFIVDYLENVAAHFFVHMWDNKPWQRHYVLELKKKFPKILGRDFQRAVLINSLGQAYWWVKDLPELIPKQLDIFREALEPNHYSEIL